MTMRLNVSLLLSSSLRDELPVIREMMTWEHCHPLCKIAL